MNASGEYGVEPDARCNRPTILFATIGAAADVMRDFPQYEGLRVVPIESEEPARPAFVFDGLGINGPDEYRSRIATFIDHARAAQYGKQFEAALNAAPDLLEALEYIAGHARMAATHANETGRIQSLHNVVNAAEAAIQQAKGVN